MPTFDRLSNLLPTIFDLLLDALRFIRLLWCAKTSIGGRLTRFNCKDCCVKVLILQAQWFWRATTYALPWRTYASTDVYYASGFSNGDPNIPGDRLQPHTTFDATLSKEFGEGFSVSVTGLNVANRRVLLDNSQTFGGTHFLNPRELFIQLRYRFHW
jgi:hypothetical protein